MTEVHTVTTYSELNRIIKNNERVVVAFGAPSWCIPCQRLVPHFAAAAKQLPEVQFVEVDIENSDEKMLEEFTIKSVPTVLVFTDGVAKPVVARTAPLIVNEVNND